MSPFVQDIRYALRLLVKQPAFTLVAILTLAIGIGANTAIFSVVNAVVLRPLPYDAPDDLVMLWSNTQQTRGGATSPNDFLDWRREQRSFEAIAAMANDSKTLTGAGGEALRLRGVDVSASLFPILRVAPAMGRGFTADEEQPGAPPVVVLSHGLWERRFASDPKMVGREIELDGVRHTVVGIMPPGFDFPAGIVRNAPDYWLPLALDATQDNRGAHYLRTLGRLKPGVAIGAAQSEMTALARRLEEQYPLTNTSWGIWLFPLHEEFAGGVRTPLYVLLGAVAFVLLIACANVANLLLARAAARSRELAVRSALGAGRGRLVRQLLTESVVLAGLGGLAGLGVAAWLVDLVPVLAGNTLPRASSIALDGAVLAFTLGATVLTGVVFGVVPALHAGRAPLAESLRSGGRSTGAHVPRRIRTALVVGEIALAFVLLIGAGLLIRSFQHLASVEPGFRAEKVMTASLVLPRAAYEKPAQQGAFAQQYLDRVRALPGVISAAATSLLPLGGADTILVFSVEGRPDDGPGKWPLAHYTAASDDYFETLGIRLERGRLFEDRDVDGATRVALVSASLARKYFANEDAVGQRIKVAPPQEEAPWHTVVGVVEDVRHRGLAQDAAPMLYLPLAQAPSAYMSLVVRTAGDPLELVPPMRTQLRGLDRGLALDDLRTMDVVVSRSLASERFRTRLLAAFALVALLLAAIGVYGVMAYSVEQRTQEMGLRMALGAQPSDVLSLVAGDGLRITLAGIIVGVAAAFALTRVVTSLLFGVSATDPLTFGLIGALLLAVAALASYVPARRATRTDPMIVLRSE